MNKKIKHIKYIYEYLVSKIYNRNSINININRKVIDIFINKYDNQLNNDFIWDYISFQLEYWDNKKTEYSLRPLWIFGIKAIERWENKDSNWNYYTQLFLNKYEIEKPVTYYKNNLTDKFEEERKRFFGTENGLLNCFASSFYDKKSKYCKICEYKDICEKM